MAFHSKYDDNIMHSVFKYFLGNPPDSLLHKDDYTRNYIDQCVNTLSHSDGDIVRWHIAVLLDNFVLDQNIASLVCGRMNPENPADRLNRSGQQFYIDLCNRLKTTP